MSTNNKYVVSNDKIIYLTANFATLNITGLSAASEDFFTLDTPIQPEVGESEADFWTRAKAELNAALVAKNFILDGETFVDFVAPAAVLLTTEVELIDPVATLKNVLSTGSASLTFSLTVTGANTIGTYVSSLQTSLPTTYNQQQLNLILGI